MNVCKCGHDDEMHYSAQKGLVRGVCYAKNCDCIQSTCEPPAEHKSTTIKRPATKRKGASKK